jgi:hypothetical protein
MTFVWIAGWCWRRDGITSIEVRWHHLVMAVGNFKRQPGRRLKPCRLSYIDQPAHSPEKIFVLPSGLVVDRDEESSWMRLSDLLAQPIPAR